MKFMMIAALVLSTQAFAGHHDKKMEAMKKLPFEDHKKMMQEKLEKKSGMIEEAKMCVNNAKDNSALMDCHKKMKEEKHAMKDEMLDKMKGMKKKSN